MLVRNSTPPGEKQQMGDAAFKRYWGGDIFGCTYNLYYIHWLKTMIGNKVFVCFSLFFNIPFKKSCCMHPSTTQHTTSTIVFLFLNNK